MDLTGRRLRVLYLTHHSPWPQSSGGRVRDAQLLERLTTFADVEVWAVSRRFEDDELAAQQNPIGATVRIFPDESVRKTFPTRNNAEVRALLQRMATTDFAFDVIHIEGHYLAHMVPDALMDRVVVAEHNIESDLVSQRQRISANGAREVLNLDLSEVRQQEQSAWRRACRIVVLSEEDKERIARIDSALPVVVSPNGCDRPDRLASALGGRGDDWHSRVGFVANYAYTPNVDAMTWLLDELYPRIRLLANVQLLLIGSNLSTALGNRDLPSGVKPIGWVEHISDVHAMAAISVCPLRIGGGMKTKMLEALHFGQPVVSTSIGVEGLPAQARAAVIVTDDADEFAAQVAHLVNDPEERRRRAERISASHEFLPTWAEAAECLYQQWVSVAAADRVGQNVK